MASKGMTSLATTPVLGHAVVLGAAIAWIYWVSEFRVVMWLRYLALCLGVAGWCLLPGSEPTVTSPPTNEPEHEEDTPAASTTASDAVDSKPAVEEVAPSEPDDVAAEDDATEPEFVCHAPSLLRTRSRDVYLTTQEEKWARDEHGHMYLSQSSKRVLIKCPTSENESVLQRVAQGRFAGTAMVSSQMPPATAPPQPPTAWSAYVLDQVTLFLQTLLDYAVKCVGTAILMSTCALVWNYSLGINTDMSFHDLLWKHLQDV